VLVWEKEGRKIGGELKRARQKASLVRKRRKHTLGGGGGEAEVISH